MRYIILFQHSCNACSEVAKMVGDISIAGLEARPLEDPQVGELLSNSGREIPDRPSLLIIDNDDVEMISGWAMRRRLAGVAGWRRSGTIVRLLAAEWRARLARAAGSHTTSRRKVLTGLVAGAVAGGFAWGLKSPSLSAASPGPGQGKPEVTVASPAEAGELLATASVQRSIRAWGPVHDIFKLGGAQPAFMLSHPRDGITTVVDNSPGAVRAGNPVALSLGKSPVTTDAMRYYTVDASPLVDVSVSNGRAAAMPVRNDDEPDGLNVERYKRFVTCVGTTTSPGCAQGCITCAAHLNVICAAACAVCAGPAGLKCAFYIWS